MRSCTGHVLVYLESNRKRCCTYKAINRVSSILEVGDTYVFANGVDLVNTLFSIADGKVEVILHSFFDEYL